MCADPGDHVRIELETTDLRALLSLYRWNTWWTGLGAIAGWLALTFVAIAILG